MKPSSLKLVALVVLSVVLFLALCGCSPSQGSLGVSSPSGSGGNPYMIDVVLATSSCPSWHFVIADIPDGKPWCAASVPLLHAGDEVKLFAGGISGQLFRVSAIDWSRHLVTLSDI